MQFGGHITEAVLGLICGNSPFVPGDREAIFVSSILNFFRRDMISALHTLVPQLENSLRHVLRMQGYDVTKLNEDMTQQDLALSALLDRMRPELEKILGLPWSRTSATCSTRPGDRTSATVSLTVPYRMGCRSETTASTPAGSFSRYAAFRFSGAGNSCRQSMTRTEPFNGLPGISTSSHRQLRPLFREQRS